MKTRLLAIVGSATLLLGMPVMPSASAAALSADSADDAKTEDIVYMADGRALHGQILEETRSSVILQFVDRASGISTKLTLKPDEIVRIERDVALVAPETEGDSAKSGTRSGGFATDDEGGTDIATTYGVHRASADENVTSFYLIPMRGQMGTDIHQEVYEDIIEDIRASNPDYLVIVMDCKDREDRLMSRIGREEAGLVQSPYLDMYRKLIAIFRHELRDIPQVLWIEDSLGISSVLAMSWENIYMKPEARLGGIAGAASQFDFVKDPEVHAKFREAYMGWLKGFAEYGKYSLDLIDAMVLPEFELSASWKGRDVIWRLDKKGEYIVDGNDKETTEFTAKTAEDFCISKGTVDTLDDLALMLGVREYRVLDSLAERIVDDYKDDWRRTWENCNEWFLDYQQAMGWANGEDTLKYLGKAKGLLERILSAADRYSAIETRLAIEFGIDRGQLIVLIERLKEQIRAISRGGTGGGGGGGGRGGAGAGGG